MEPPRSLRDLLAEGEKRLASCGIEGARLEAEVLMAHALGIDRGRLSVLLAGRGAPVAVPARAAFRRMVKRRGLREPLAYITGHREFWSLDFEVTPAVLIPRPETEILVEEALKILPHGGAALVADVGTGSGAVAVALAKERPRAFIAATDISEEALAVARRNASRHGVASRVGLVRGDLIAMLGPPRAGDARPRLVVSNPPYVGLDERAILMPEVRDHEPPQALYAGAGGLEIIERLLPQAGAFLGPGGWLLMEVAAPRAADVARMLEASGAWQDVAVRDDYAALPRVARARRRAVEEADDQRR